MAEAARVFLLKAHVPSGMEFFVLREPGVTPHFWFNAAGALQQSTLAQIPHIEYGHPVDITPYDSVTGVAPTWIEVEDAATTVWYLTSVAGVLTKNASPPGTGFGWDARADGVGMWSQDPTVRYILTGHATNPYTITLDAGAEVPALYYSAGLGRQPAIFDDRMWEPRLLDIFDINQSARITEGTVGGLVSASFGNITLDLADEAIRDIQLRPWNNALIEVWEGYANLTFGQFTKRLQARVRSISLSGGRFTIILSDEQDALTAAFHLSTYAGTGGLEGPDAALGKPKPLFYGAAVTPSLPLRLLDKVNDVYEISEGTPDTEGQIALYDKGLILTPAGAVADVYAWTPVAGQWVYQTGTFIVRLGAPPVGRLSAGQTGGRASAYTPFFTAGNLLRQILDERGITYNTTNISSWPDTALQSGYFTDQATTLQRVLNFLLPFCFWGFRPDTSDLFLSKIQLANSQVVLDDTHFVDDRSFQLQAFTPPPTKLRLSVGPNWNVFRDGELVDNVIGSGQAEQMTSEHFSVYEHTDARVSNLNPIAREATIDTPFINNLSGSYITALYTVLAGLVFVAKVTIRPTTTAVSFNGDPAGSLLRPGFVVQLQTEHFDNNTINRWVLTGVRSIARKTVRGEIEELQELTLWGGVR